MTVRWEVPITTSDLDFDFELWFYLQMAGRYITETVTNPVLAVNLGLDCYGK